MPRQMFADGAEKLGVVIFDFPAEALGPVRNKDGTTTNGKVVTTSSTALSLTRSQHAEREVIILTDSTVANTFTMPEATGSGDRYKARIGIAQTQGSFVFAALGADVFRGVARMFDASAAADAMNFNTSATSDKATLNRTTTGGLGYDTIELVDVADGIWQVDLSLFGTGTLATPFAAT
jgi:hypothetical protein